MSLTPLPSIFDDIKYIVNTLLGNREPIPGLTVAQPGDEERKKMALGGLIESSTLENANMRYVSYPEYIKILEQIKTLCRENITKLDERYKALEEQERKLPPVSL